MLNEGLVLNYGMDANTKKQLLEAWKPQISAVKKVNKNLTENQATSLAIALENAKREMEITEKKIAGYGIGLNEDVQVTNIRNWKWDAYELIAAVFPNLIAQELVSVQPLKQKIGQIFYLEYIYGSTKGDIKAGDPMFAFNYINGKSQYTSEHVDSEIFELKATADSYSIPWKPVRPGSVKLTVTSGSTVTEYIDYVNPNLNPGFDKAVANAYQEVPAPAAGAWGSFKNATTGVALSGVLINYNTGVITYEASVFQANDEANLEYDYNLEYSPAEAPQLDLNIKAFIVQARTRKLRARYAFDAAYDIQMQHGFDVETDLAGAAAAEIRHEIDREIINDLTIGADGYVNWKSTQRVGVNEYDHNLTFVNTVIKARNAIFKATRRVAGNWLIVGEAGANILESLSDNIYKAIDDNGEVGPHFAGTLKGTIKVYKDPFFGGDLTTNGSLLGLVGHKGSSLVDTGYVYAPYLPIFSTKVIMLDDFVGRQGWATSYAKKMINPKYYCRILNDTTGGAGALAVTGTVGVESSASNPVYTYSVASLPSEG